MIRRARESDVDQIVALCRELAEYEQAPEHFKMTAEQLRPALFGEAPSVFCHVAEVDGGLAGCAVWFRSFSTWTGTHGIHLEDLYVRPQHRGTGLGKQLLVALARECVRAGYQRLEWAVLDWNEPTIEFYRRLGATHVDDWMTFRLDGDALTTFAS
ncbi:GNAT family N-acetyltransferase [Labedaea rhizosphaerae]|uniref:L-amino acid N-acyltransferase YncA n=1 Tax=Labedaea rhizosphaerae TaxID=598644 RepID=A0A4R6S3V0_LABRH|nr:GNAT family N-acetyltransferase [Labedaea rhizosphaerae]TDP93757.1 L-amino acid N-acyltransferase YncA [Labedaea rhizosphaerae]